MGRRRVGEMSADFSAGAPDGLRNDIPWRRPSLSLGLSEPIRHSISGCSVWHPLPRDTKARAPSSASEKAGARYTDVPCASRRGSPLGDVYVQVTWSSIAQGEGSISRVLRVLWELRSSTG